MINDSNKQPEYKTTKSGDPSLVCEVPIYKYTFYLVGDNTIRMCTTETFTRRKQ